jgi:tryptophan-rich sensory protein
MVRRARQAVLQPAGLGVRASLGRALCVDRIGRLAQLRAGRCQLADWLWWAQLALNFLWSPVFFAAHRIGLALVVILLLLAAILAFIALSWRRDRVSAWLFVPYAAWVAFASVLNGAILFLN